MTIQRYKCLDPRGSRSDIQYKSLTERKELIGNKVFLLDICRPNSDTVSRIVKQHMKDFLPDSELVYHGKKNGYRYDEASEWWETLYREAAGVVLLVGDCGSGTMRMLEIQNQLEDHGVPTVSIVCTPFIEDARAVSHTLGRNLRWIEIPYPITDITDDELEKNIAPKAGAFAEALIKPLTAEEQFTGVVREEQRPRYLVEGTILDIQEFFSEQELTDGLPIIPPTDAAVEAMLKGTSHAKDELVGKIPVEYLNATVEKVAINGVMCGCLPEHMPILLTICEILADKQMDVNVSVRSTTGFAYWGFVNGPVAKEIGMNSSTNALGPGNSANATIGRAIRMFIHNLGGARVGVNEMATMGNPLKYGFSFAENEAESPWPPYHVDKGFDAGESCVTVCESWGFRTQGLTSYGKVMGLENILWSAKNVESAFGLGKERGIMILLDPLLAKQLAARGIKKQDIQEYMWKNLTRTVAEWKNCLSYSSDVRGNLYPAEYLDLSDDVEIPKLAGPKNVQIVVVGGENSPFYQIYDSVNPYHCVTKSIEKWR